MLQKRQTLLVYFLLSLVQHSMQTPKHPNTKKKANTHTAKKMNTSYKLVFFRLITSSTLVWSAWLFSLMTSIWAMQCWNKSTKTTISNNTIPSKNNSRVMTIRGLFSTKQWQRSSNFQYKETKMIITPRKTPSTALLSITRLRISSMEFVMRLSTIIRELCQFTQRMQKKTNGNYCVSQKIYSNLGAYHDQKG